MSSDKCVSIWDQDFADRENNLLNLVEDWKGNRMYSISE